MPNLYYNAPADNVPLTTVRSANENTDRASVEAAFDLIPAQSDLQRVLYGTDISTVVNFYEVTVPYLTGSYIAGQEITFEAVLANTGAASIQINGGVIVDLVDSTGAALSNNTIIIGQVVKCIYTTTGNFRIINVINVGTTNVDQAGDYTWTGSHDFTGATVTGLSSVVDLDASYPWTGAHAFAVTPTINGNPVFNATNINTAVITVTEETGTSYTAVLGDRNGLTTLNNAAAIAYTVPPNSSVAYPIGTTLSICQTGAGQVTITPGSGVTLSSSLGLLTDAQYAFATLLKIQTDTWLVTGSLTT